RNVKCKYSEDYIKFGFTCQEKEGVDLPQCVICFKVLGNDSMKSAKLKLHLEKCHPQLVAKWRLSGLKWQHLDSTSAFYNKTSNAVRASYIVAYQVAQAKKPHTIVEQLVLPCIRLVLGKEAARKLNDISVSNNTVSRQVNEISQNISEQVVDEIKKSPLFAIQLNELTDVALCSQLLVFAGYMVEGDFKDKFLFCKTLDTTTKAQGVMEIVNNFFEVHGLDWVNLVGVTTDGAPAMLGSRSGFHTPIKQRAPMVTRVHCFIPKEALASKTLPDQLNRINSLALNIRLFKRFCLDMCSDFDVLLFYTSVRWLSAENVLNRVFQLREELDLFLQAQRKEEFQNVLMQSNLELEHLVDIFGILNKLNLQLQGKGANLFFHQSIIKAFLDKLELWIVRVEGNNLVQYPYVDAMLGEKEAIRTQIPHLWKLRDEFQRYFPEVDRTKDGLSFIRNTFTTDVNSVPEDLQEEFLDVKNDFAAQDMYQQSTTEKFCASVTESYPNLSAPAVRFLLPFASTYMCETGFLCLLHNKEECPALLNLSEGLKFLLAPEEKQSSLLKKSNLKLTMEFL
uniref:DUF4371 domain-containing protein n=1 Tax=Pelodiscus sinensis TaxID=13735 RepID=K7G5P4_PELSI